MTKRDGSRLLGLVFACLLAFGASAQGKIPDYRLGSGDTIRITVFQNPDLTVETRVTENGMITYPLVGSLHVGGLTVAQAQQVIAKALAEGNFIRHPQVNILLVQNRGNQVSVLGAVNKPGRYPLETFDTRVSEMIAIAGGISPNGSDTVILTGTRNGKPIRKAIDIPDLFLGGKQADDIYVAGGDEIYVDREPKFYIYGEVQRPGSYRVERGMTIRQALAQGGGLTQRGTARGLRVYHHGGVDRQEPTVPLLSDPVWPGDVIYVEQSMF